MRTSLLLSAALLTFSLVGPTPKATGQIAVQVDPPPECPYGYYDYPPYACAPYGYYGPEWFRNGIFIGAGPWFHGDPHFRGHVNNHYDPRRGYHGEMPQRGEPPREEPPRSIHANELRDGRGHAVDKHGRERGA